MLLWILGIAFFAVTFGPRYFKLMNFGYGFFDLGLYTQFFYDMTQGFFNPYIPTLNQTFLNSRPQPLMVLLWPVSFFTTQPAVFLFLDEISIVCAAAVCANFTWRKTQDSVISIAIFTVILFSPLLMGSLHGAGSIELWAQPFLALLFTEYFSRRRPLFMTLWFLSLCLLNLNFCVLGILLVPLTLFTQGRRWKFSRRIEVALPITVAGLFCLGILHSFNGELHFGVQFFWAHFGAGIMELLLCFWFLPLLFRKLWCSDFSSITMINGQPPSPALLVILSALGCVVFFERLKLHARFKVYRILAMALIASSVYYNLRSEDPFFRFWEAERWAISDENKKVHEMISHIPPTDTVAASENFIPLLGGRLSLMTLGSVNWRQGELPRYILSRNELVSDPRFSKIEENLKTGTRLFIRTK